MPKIVFLNIPAYGHVNPTLPVARELVERGEQVIYYNNEEFRAVIEPTRAAFRAYPPSSLSASAIAKAMESGNLINATDLLLQVTDELLPFVLAEVDRERPDLVIFDSTVLWGRMAATMLDLRAAASITTFVFGIRQAQLTPLETLVLLARFLPKVPGILKKRSRLIRRYKAGYPQGQPLFPMRAGLNLVFTARELQPDMPLIDETFRFIGPAINPETRRDDFPFDALRPGKLVYISLGTVHAGQLEFYRKCFDLFADHPAQFVLSAGTNVDLRQLEPIPSNFIVRGSVPQLAILERADVFVTHAGINSIHESMYYGVPVVAIPQQFEQLMNAVVVVKQGAGVVIRKQLTRGRVPLEELRPAVDAVLTQPRFRQAAERVQAILRATGGYRQAADELQAYIAASGENDQGQ